MTGGEISLNSATSGNGGGIYQYNAPTGKDLVIAGGKITQNTGATGKFGGGISVVGNFYIAGDANITGNVIGGTIKDGVLSGGTTSNLYLGDLIMNVGYSDGNINEYNFTGKAGVYSNNYKRNEIFAKITNNSDISAGDFSNNRAEYLFGLASGADIKWDYRFSDPVVITKPTATTTGLIRQTAIGKPSVTRDNPLNVLNTTDYEVSNDTFDDTNPKVTYTLKDTTYGVISFEYDLPEKGDAGYKWTVQNEPTFTANGSLVASHSSYPGLKIDAGLPVLTSEDYDILVAGNITTFTLKDKTYGEIIIKIDTDDYYLAEVKADKIAELKDYVNSLNESDYSPENWATILNEQTKAIAAINGQTTIEGVGAAKDAGIAAIESVKTLEQIAAEEAAALQAAKDAAKSELDNYVENQSSAVEAIIDTAKADIDGAATQEAVADLLAQAKADVDAKVAEETAAAEAAALQAAKDAAKAELDDLLKDDSSDAVKEIIAKAKNAIDGAATQEAVADLLAQAKADVDAKVAEETAAAEAAALQAAKDEAIKAINDKVAGLTESNYSSENWQAILDEQTKAIAAINGQTTIEGVGAAKDAGIAAIESVKTLEQIAAEEAAALQAAKDAAKSELDNYVENQSSAVEAIIDAAKSEITDALDQTAIDKIVEDAKAAIDTKVAEEAALQAAKDAAIKAINDKVAGLIESDYSPENWKTILSEQTKAIDAINAQKTIEGVGAAKDAGIAAINGVKTLEQIAAEELQAAKDDAKAELDNYVENPSSAVEAIIDAAKSEITDALDQTAIDKIVEDAKAAIDTKVAEEAALQAAKDAAIKAINDKVADLIESDYSPENWATIQEELADAIAEINSLETVAEVAASDVDSIKPKIDAVETIVETIARELAEAKADKICELEDYVNSLNESDYSEENWAAIQEELADAIAEINSLETVTEVDAYDVDSIKTKIDVIETLPQEESLNLWWIIITLLVVMIGEIIVIIFKKRSNSKLYSIAMPLFFVRIIPNGAWTIITILAIIVFALTAYIIYLFLKGNPKAQVVDVIIPVVEEKQNREIKDYSFKAKLHLAETETVENYDVLKNYILSFKDVTIRESWGYERFMYGGKSILKLRPSGKSLKIYINLDHKKYENTKFKLEDVSHKKIHETTPSLFVVTGPRKLIWAKELVEGYMNEVGAVKDENYIPKDYRVDRKTTKELIEKGLIKTAILNETYKKIIDGEK